MREIVTYDHVSIDLTSEGSGPLIVLLPSRGRDLDDFDIVAAGLAQAGFRVLRPQPRGAGASKGPSDGIRMQDLARDVAFVIEREKAGPAVIVGHAFGNWVARMVATDHRHLVRGVALVAAAAKTFPDSLRADVQQSANAALPNATRLEALRRGFFFPGHDASVWLHGWAPEANRIQGLASAATKQAEYWQAGGVPILDVVPDSDPFKPKEKWFESREEFGDRVTVTIIPNASHALIPEQPQAVVEAVASWARRLPQP
ncbi:alpha/beta hydrolase [Rhabdaerophilum sp. SD176]|uniref:alpha/beta fold hydrolase n=1 Tax=Rhabdaerophilum sp. SD176 TaxID=2983548 RepID=UPI0024DF7DA8|nr:alpha/beta hydrolase [Rhabdaerophilum sp. SD176]